MYHGFKMHFQRMLFLLKWTIVKSLSRHPSLVSLTFQEIYTELISGIYWISSQHNYIFTLPVTVEIQHCVPKDLYHPSSLT